MKKTFLASFVFAYIMSAAAEPSVGYRAATNIANACIAKYDETNLTTRINAKQNNLVSGTNIKTVNGNSLLGSGNIVIQGGSGGGGADTNTVNDLIRSYDETNLTARINAKVDAKYTWVRPDDWTLGYSLSNANSTAVSGYATEDDSFRIISNVTFRVTTSIGGWAYLETLDPTSDRTTPIDAFFAVSPNISVSAATGAFVASEDGMYKIGARRGGDVRYADIAAQTFTNRETQVRFYAEDISGSGRKAVNDAAKLILDNATFVKSNEWVEIDKKDDGTKTTNHHRYAVYNTFEPRMASVGWPGNASPFAVSRYVLASANHYDRKYTGNQIFDDGNGHRSTVVKKRWINLREWALTNNFDKAYVDQCGIGDIDLVPCDRNAGAVPDGCIPYFMDETKMKELFGESMIGVCAWTFGQTEKYAIPIVMREYNMMAFSPGYYWTYKSDTRKDVCDRLEEMGIQYPIHSGDSGRPIFVMVDGKPVILSAWCSGGGPSSGIGPSYVKGYEIIKAFVESYGDELKTL